MNKIKSHIYLISFSLLLFYVFSIFYRSDSSFNQDLGRHLRLGEIIVQTKNVPLINLFSYTYPDFPFINSHWLFEVLIYVTQQAVGLQTVLVLKIGFFLLAVILILKIIPKKQYLLLPISYIFLHTLRERPDLRPEIFSFLFTSLTLYILDKYSKTKTRLVYLLPAIQLIWVNAHIYFIVGIALQGIYIAQYIFNRKFKELMLSGIIFGLSVIASLINPSGLTGFLNPFTFTQNYGYTIAENQTLFLLESLNFRNSNFIFVKIASVIILLSIVVALVRKRLSVKNLGLSVFGLIMALLNIRSFPYLFFISLPAVLENFGEVKFNLLSKVAIIITIFLLISESFLYLNGDYYKYTDSNIKPKLEFTENGKNALDFVLANKLSQPIFNNFDIGSYITYRGWPAYRIFVDGRPGEYPKEFFQNVYIPMQSNSQKFKEIDFQYGFKTIIFSITDQTPWGADFMKFIVKDTDWVTVYLDDFMIVLVKKDQLKNNNLRPIDLKNIEPENYLFQSYISYIRIGYFLQNVGYIEPAKLFTKKALEMNPDSRVANSLMLYFVSIMYDFSENKNISNYLNKSENNFWW